VTRGRIPALDGFRALSIGLVIVAHALAMSRTERLLGDTGVRAFFVISGYLITTLLLRERATRGRISLRAFYARRAVRIFPAFYAYLAVIGVLAVAGVITVAGRDFAAAATYTMNFVRERSFYVGHAWSLAVEEQFYLLWPVALVLCGARRATWLALAGVAIAPVLRVAAVRYSPSLGPLTDQAFPFVFDALGTGCTLAILAPRLAQSPRYAALLDSRWFWYVPALCLASLVVGRWWFELGVAESLANLGIALAIHGCIARPQRLATRVLEQPALVWVGTLSYSLYLWQEPFMNHETSWCPFPANIAFAFAAAAISHYLIEKPVLRAGRRMLGLA
jgi:peptidoglycan/LPS O-acetylase OafA/YrhL